MSCGNRGNHRDVSKQSTHRCAYVIWHVAAVSARFQTNSNFIDVFEFKKKYIKFHENPPSGVELYRVDGHHEANSRFSSSV